MYGWSPYARSKHNLMANQNEIHVNSFILRVIGGKLLTHWCRDKMDAISQTTLSNAFFVNENVKILIEISLKFVPKGPALVQTMAWRRPGDKPLFEPMMVSLLTLICVTRPQWVYGPDIFAIMLTWFIFSVILVKTVLLPTIWTFFIG